MSTVMPDSFVYATPFDITNRYDIRDLCQWCSDTTAPVPQNQIAGSTALLACIADASGMIEAAVFVTERYTAQDLQSLYTSGGNSAAFLIRLTCDLAVGLLMERRPYLERDVPPQFLRALEWLEQLRDGKRIFAFEEVSEAGDPEIEVDSYADVQNRNLSSYQASRYFGQRANQFQPGNAPGQGSSLT